MDPLCAALGALDKCSVRVKVNDLPRCIDPSHAHRRKSRSHRRGSGPDLGHGPAHAHARGLGLDRHAYNRLHGRPCNSRCSDSRLAADHRA